ncbi:MAG: nuclear transport factor 2 family protein [Pseudomonadota bacterium]
MTNTDKRDGDLQSCKRIVRQYIETFDHAVDYAAALADVASVDYRWRGVHPFYEQPNVDSAIAAFWAPLRSSFRAYQRREDIFFAGISEGELEQRDEPTVWTCSMGHFTGLMDDHWLGIPPTGKFTFIPYAEFHRIDGDRIAETALFIDVVSVMAQAGRYPLPPPTGAHIIQPGPRTHDGLLFEAQDPAEGARTLALTERMVSDLSILNETGDDECSPDVLRKTWDEQMIWYGPTGIGATTTITRYQKQHQYPFRRNLADKVFNGHVARIAEGNYAGWFGWPNLHNSSRGGFLGMTANAARAEMRVVDIYRREGDKLVENWVFIDLLHYLYGQGLDVLARSREIDRIPD